jgi:CheY-like chemotaxis protein
MSPKKLNILLADDESEIALLVSTVLRQSGHTVEVSEDGQAALSKLKEKPDCYDLVITDSNMPLVSGIQVIEYLRSTDFKGKIMLLSGNVTEELQDVYTSLRIDRIVEKPFVLGDLRKTVEELIATT